MNKEDKITKKIQYVSQNKNKYRCPDLIIAGLRNLLIMNELGELGEDLFG